jgi:hypothetical protein
MDEFLISASDGLWDYFAPESSVLTEARRTLRAQNNDPQVCCVEGLEWGGRGGWGCTFHPCMCAQFAVLTVLPSTAGLR